MMEERVGGEKKVLKNGYEGGVVFWSRWLGKLLLVVVVLVLLLLLLLLQVIVVVEVTEVHEK